MAKIQYVGLKEARADTVAGTGIVWHGQGDVREVPDLAVSRLLRHPDIWRLHVAEQVASPPPPPAPSPAPVVAPVKAETSVPHNDEESKTNDSAPPPADAAPAAAPTAAPSVFVMQTEAGPLVLDGMERDTLMALAKESNLSPHPQTGAEKLRALLVKKFPVEGK
jgi:hypothetical protein